jgi:hypothetical protein
MPERLFEESPFFELPLQCHAPFGLAMPGAADSFINRPRPAPVESLIFFQNFKPLLRRSDTNGVGMRGYFRPLTTKASDAA